jgi:hypothetical protein
MIVPKQQLIQVQKVSYLYASKGGKKKNYITCPVCKQAPCYKHCNNCGKDIEIKQDSELKWHPYEVMTGTIHKGCHKNGTKSGQYLDVNAKKYECILFREDHFNRYFLVRENGQLRRVIEKKQDYHKMTPEQFRDSIMTKHTDYEKWGAFTFEY